MRAESSASSSRLRSLCRRACDRYRPRILGSAPALLEPAVCSTCCSVLGDLPRFWGSVEYRPPVRRKVCIYLYLREGCLLCSSCRSFTGRVRCRGATCASARGPTARPSFLAAFSGIATSVSSLISCRDEGDGQEPRPAHFQPS